MDRIFILLLVAAMAAPAAGAYGADGNSREAAAVAGKPAKKFAEVTFSVSMHCEKCVGKITDNISFEKGVKDLKVDLDKHIVWIRYDPSKTDETALKTAIEKLGYEVRKTGGE